MAIILRFPFSHRHNPDGTYDSICNKCFMTVGTKRKEVDLLEVEQSHVCDEEDLDEEDLNRIEHPLLLDRE